MSSLLAMRIGDTRPFIDRNYRDITQPGQWLRETFRNAEEAEASNVHYGIEWQGVETQRVYRRYVADDGIGMNEDDLDTFMLTYGGGGKPIGTEHENFGIGAKVTLLPWNPAGLLVISYKRGQGYAMLMRGDEREYGAAPWEALDEDGEVVHAAVIDPQDAPLPEFGIADIGSIWQQIPFWAEAEDPPDHGTIFLLLGPEKDHDTILGDPNRPEESTTYMQALHLNMRLWAVREGQTITVDVPVGNGKTTWTTRNPGQIEGGPGTGGFTRRRITGARDFIDRGGRLPITSGQVKLDNETIATWYLRDETPDKRPNPYGPRAGFIAVLYKDELYDIARAEDAKWRYRQFGIPAAEVMARTFIVIEPPLDGANGIYPTGGRDRLLRKGARDLPFTNWGATFHEHMPTEIAAAIELAMPKEISADSAWKDKFAERFWDRLHHTRFRLHRLAAATAAEATQTAPRVVVPPSTEVGGSSEKKLPRLAAPRARTTERLVSDLDGDRPARKTDMEAAIPSWLPVGADEMDKSYTLGSWDPEKTNPDGSRGCVYLNRDHPAVIALVEEMASAYSVGRDDVGSWQLVERAVWETLGQSLVAKVVHTQAVLRRDVERMTLKKEYLSDVALTTAGLGMIWEQQALQPKLGGILGRKKAS
jgi:hypothetical protein